MLDPAVLWVIGATIVVLPLVLTVVFHRTHQADARGRRLSRRWQGRPLGPGGPPLR